MGGDFKCVACESLTKALDYIQSDVGTYVVCRDCETDGNYDRWLNQQRRKPMGNGYDDEFPPGDEFDQYTEPPEDDFPAFPPQPKAQPTQPTQSVVQVDTEALSSNMYWTLTGKSGEAFHIQTTIRGNPSIRELREHLNSAKLGMGLIVNEYHGKPKPVGAASHEAAKVPTGVQNYRFNTWQGKAYLSMNNPEDPLPEAIKCPLHDVTAKGKDGQYGYFWSHKSDQVDGGWCRISVSKKK